MENQFDRIIAVSLNPALDVTLWVNTLDFNEPNKTTDEKVYAGGKAVNIARVFASYGAENACMSGSGPTVFGIFDDRKTAERAQQKLRDSRLARQIFLTEAFHNGGTEDDQ